MYLTKIKLTNFRNITNKELSFGKATVLLADNTRGKTNILEAIFYLSTGRSFRAEKESEVIRADAQFADIEGMIVSKEEKTKLRVFISNENETKKKMMQVNGVNRNLSNFSGHLKVIIFTPENFDILYGSPTIRRRYLDSILVQVDRKYARSLSQYKKVTYQRNRLLERIRERKAQVNELDYWNRKLIELGRLIQETRYQLISFLDVQLNNYSFLHRKQKRISLIYESNLVNEERLIRYQPREIEAGVTLIGPHRDDLGVNLEGKKIITFGSRGEQRLAILSLSLTALEFVEHMVNKRPLLLLDDIFSELDAYHRSSVLEVVKKQQTIITTTDWEFKTTDIDDLKIINL